MSHWVEFSRPEEKRVVERPPHRPEASSNGASAMQSVTSNNGRGQAVENPGSEQVRAYFIETEQYDTQIKTLRDNLGNKVG